MWSILLNRLLIRNEFVHLQVFVPSYSGNKMVMLKINGLDDYDKLPLTKWNIKQPNDGEGRENASETGQFADISSVPIYQHKK